MTDVTITDSAWGALVAGPATGKLRNTSRCEVFYLQCTAPIASSQGVPRSTAANINVMPNRTKSFNIEAGVTVYGIVTNGPSAIIQVTED